jgi:hypothetical protein
MEERKADNEHSNPRFYCPSPLNSQHLHFQFTVASLLKFLLEVVAIGRKNAGKDPDTPPLPIATASQTAAFFLCPFVLSCPPMGESGGGIFAGREGGIESMK